MRTGFVLLCASFVCVFFGLLGYVLGGASGNFLGFQFGAAFLFFVSGMFLSGFRVIASFFARAAITPSVLGRRVLIAIVTVAGIIVLNAAAGKSAWRYDTTESSIFSLTAETRAVLSELNTPVHLYAVSAIKPQDTYRRKELLALFKGAGEGKIVTDVIDPLRSPRKAAELGVLAGTSYVITFTDRASVLVEEDTEQEITRVLYRYVAGGDRPIYFLAGHGEPSLRSVDPGGLSNLSALLGKEQVIARHLLLAETGKVPDDAAALAIVAPREELPPAELQVIKEYVKQGGDLLLFFEPYSTQSVRALSEELGITVTESVVLDKTQRLFDAPEIGWQITTRAYKEHDIVFGLKDTDLSVFLLAVSLEVQRGYARKNSVTSFIETSSSAWAERDLEALFADTPVAEFDSAIDTKGPISIAMTAEVERGKAGASRVVVFGDSTWLRNQNLSVYANEELAARSFLWAISSRNAVINRPRSYRRSVILLSAASFKGLLLSSFVLPELIFLIGLFVWWRRMRPVVQ